MKKIQQDKTNEQIFKDIDLSILWERLSETLAKISENSNEMQSVVNPNVSRLLPIIETFFLTQDCLEVKEEEGKFMQLSANESLELPSFNQQLQHSLSSQTYQSNPFVQFCEKNKKILNLLVKQNPQLLYETFAQLVKNFPFLLDFDNKRKYFNTELKKLRQHRHHHSSQIKVSRQHIFIDSFNELRARTVDELYGKLQVQFKNEQGVDAGGLSREWYLLLSREIFNPDYALFTRSAGNVTFQPNPKSNINQNHLEYFKFVGRFIGKAIYDNQLLDAFFTRAFYKHMIGQPVTYHDMEDLDTDCFKSLKWMLETDLNDPKNMFEQAFVIEEDLFGKTVIVDLVTNGSKIQVTNENKKEYVTEVCQRRLFKSIEQQVKAFLEGFYEIIPKKLISIFNTNELELLISGMPDIDCKFTILVEDLKANTEYYNYSPNDQVIKWLWEILENYGSAEKAAFIQFVTGNFSFLGTSKVPLEGFCGLQGIRGVTKFNIHKSHVSSDHLPTAHTCMNQLDLPEYPSKELLAERLTMAIIEGKEGFLFV